MADLFDTQNEIALLSILLNSPEIASNISVREYMMTSSINRTLLQTIIEMSLKNLLPEAGLVIQTLGTTGRLDEIGGQDYINYLKNQKYLVENLEQYEKLIIDAYRIKNLIEVGSELVRLKDAKNPNVQDIINSTTDKIDNIALSGSSENTQSLNDVLKDGFEVIKHRLENPTESPDIATGVKQLDDATGGISNTLWIVAARPHSCKTMCLLNFALHSAKQGKPVLFHSLEMNKTQFTEKILGIETGIPIADIHLGRLKQDQVNTIENALKRIKGLPLYLDTCYDSTLPYVTANIKKYHSQKGIKTVFIDYIQLMAERDNNATHELGQISRRMLLLANDLEIGCVVASQLNRSVEMREDKHPVMSDLRQSGNLEEDAFVLAMLYRDELYNKNSSKFKGKLEIILEKNKQTGYLGSLLVPVDVTTNRILEE